MGAAPAPDSAEESSLIGDLGDSKCWPPGFRFHPTDEELVLYYLKRKICCRRIKPRVIGDVDVYKLEPWELPGKSELRSGDKQWYFFSPRDRKYPNGSRSNRATTCGYWKATGKDRTISNNSKPVGNKKTLVYYQGRAPRGQRTDWVMHEYSMDDQALVNCGNMQDSYALYKLFRKSGPGPKNGEQYGAPFREDEWEDNAGDAADDSLKNEEEKLCQISENHDSDCNPTYGVNMLPIDDLEDILLQMSEEQDMIMQQPACPTHQTEVDVESHGGSCIMEQSQAEPFMKHTDAWCELDGLDTGFQILQSGSTCLQAAEVSEVTLFTDDMAEGQLQAIEEFLEINDISNSQDIDQSVDGMSKKEPVNHIGELYDPDEYFDTSMFLGEAMATPDRTNPYLFLADFGEEEPFQASHFTTELWAHEQVHSMPTSVEPTQVIMERPPSGTVYTSNIPNFGEQTPNQGTQVRGVSESWFSSTISTLLDSVPSSPAFASENVLINKALVRMSSFRSAQSTTNEQNAVAGGGPTIEQPRRGQGGGFLFISLLVGLGAIFWILTIGVAVKVLKGFWSRFVSS